MNSYADPLNAPAPSPTPGVTRLTIGGFPKPPKKPQNYIEQMFLEVDQVSDQMVRETLEIIELMGERPLMSETTAEGYKTFILPKKMNPAEREQFYGQVFKDDKASLAFMQTYGSRAMLEAMLDWRRLKARNA